MHQPCPSDSSRFSSKWITGAGVRTFASFAGASCAKAPAIASAVTDLIIVIWFDPLAFDQLDKIVAATLIQDSVHANTAQCTSRNRRDFTTMNQNWFSTTSNPLRWCSSSLDHGFTQYARNPCPVSDLNRSGIQRLRSHRTLPIVDSNLDPKAQEISIPKFILE